MERIFISNFAIIHHYKESIALDALKFSVSKFRKLSSVKIVTQSFSSMLIYSPTDCLLSLTTIYFQIPPEASVKVASDF